MSLWHNYSQSGDSRSNWVSASIKLQNSSLLSFAKNSLTTKNVTKRSLNNIIDTNTRMYKTQHNSYHPVQCTLLDQSAIQQYNSTNKFCIVCERSTWNKKNTNEIMKIIFLDLPISFLYKTAQTTCSSATLHSSYNQSIIDIVKQVKLCHKWGDMATQMYHYHYHSTRIHCKFRVVVKDRFKSCYSNIRQLSCIRPYLDSKTASTIAASIVYSKLDYTVTLSLLQSS